MQQAREAVTKLARQGLKTSEFARRAANVVGRFVPYDGVCLLIFDPATMLPTAEFVENGLPTHTRSRLMEIELLDNDVNKFATLARSKRPAASLSAATEGVLERSLRQRELRHPNGFDDELRASLVDAHGTWGALTLLRRAGSQRFTTNEVELVASLAGPMAEGIRRAARELPSADDVDSVGILTVARDGEIAHANPDAKRWLDELSPTAIHAVTYRAQSTGDAYARVRTKEGRWLALRASQHDDAITVILQPAQANDLAPLIADAYGLTERERTVTQLVARGFATNEIANRLHLSPYTVQDHLKVIFDKTETSTRGELVARLFFEHYAPRLAT